MSSCWLTSIPWYQDGVWTAMILGPEVGLSIREGYQEQVAAMYCPHFPHFPPLPTIWFADKPSGKLPNIIVTSATKGRWRWCVHPDLSVWLFVCLWTGYIKRLWTNLNEVIRFSVKIRIRKFLNFQSDFSPLTDRFKTIYRRYLKRFVEGLGRTLGDELGWWKKKTITVWRTRSRCRTQNQWNTKCNLFSLAEGCTTPSAVLIFITIKVPTLHPKVYVI